MRTLKFSRAIFGLTSSPFLLGGVIQHHLDTCRAEYPMYVQEIENGLYVDDIITGGSSVETVRELKYKATEIFSEATFQLHKWHSNVPELELAEVPESEDSLSYAKQQLGIRTGECGLLGLKWDKENDTLAVDFPLAPTHPTKRGILGKVAKIYDPLGFVPPITLRGKLLYREACELKVAWDAKLPGALARRWSQWENGLPPNATLPRTLIKYQEPIQAIQLHAFGDVRGKGVAAAVYAVVTQVSGVNQGLVAAKARLAKQGLTIPRIELVSGHMAVNLIDNVHDALQGFPLITKYCWLDSSVALHWIRGDGEYKQFVTNRVCKIQSHPDMIWRHVGTRDSPADIESRGSDLIDTDL